MVKQPPRSMVFRNLIVLLLLLLPLLVLTGCGRFDPAEAFSDDRIRMEPLSFRRFSPDEIVQQITNYETYVNLNEQWIIDSADDIDEFGFEIIPDRELLVGRDIAPGRYFVVGTRSDAPGSASPIFQFERNGVNDFISVTGHTSIAHRYILLFDGDVISEQDDDVIIADASSRPPLAAHGYVYPEAAYSVPNEILPGEYFAIQVSQFSAFVETAGGRFVINRFGYVRVPPGDGFVQLLNCVLIPIESMPQIQPVINDGMEHYGQGMYKIGADIPLGTYTIQTDLFLPGTGGIQEYNINATKGLIWIGYIYYDSELNEVYRIRFTSYRGRLVMETTPSQGEREYEFLSQMPSFAFEHEGGFIRLIKTRLVL